MSYDKREATAEFTRWSESYDRSILQILLFGPSHRAMVKRIGESFPDGPNAILDVGCGTGVFAARLRAAFPQTRVCGVDLVKGMLTRGNSRWRAHAAHVHPVQGDSEHLPFASGSFDVVTCANSFHHYPNQAGAIQEMRRVLRPGGQLLLIDGYRDSPYGWFIYDVCVTTAEGNVHHASRREIHQLFKTAELESIEQRVHRGFAPFLLSRGTAPAAKSTNIPRPHFDRESTPVGVETWESERVV